MKVMGMGRLTRDPEFVNSANTRIAKFSLACDRKFKREGQPSADFFNCVVFGRQADFVEKYLKKGTKIEISGRLEMNTYTNKDGNRVSTPQITCEDIEFAESKGATANNTNNANNYVDIPDSASGDELPFI